MTPRIGWEAVSLFLQRNKDRLEAKHHQFVDDMASRTVYGREPTEKQHKYLHSLFYKLGGKLT
jgi:prophage maintenance system killer protein